MKVLVFPSLVKKPVKRAKILFCGELPPATVNGISISNNRILQVLSEEFDIICVEEMRSLERYSLSSVSKIFRVLCEGVELAFNVVRYCPEIFYTTFPTSVFGSAKCLLFILLFRLLGTGRILLHVHRGDLVSFHQRGKLQRFLVEKCFDNSNKILSLSERQTYMYANITPTPVVTLTNTVEVVPTSWQQPRRPRLIFLSNYLPDKGLDTLLDAFKEVRKKWHIELHCYGGGEAGHYIARIKAESIDGVMIHGMLDEKDKYDTLQGFSLLIFPSYNEGQPLVILEAMAIGLPIVASAVGLIPEMVGDDYPFLTSPRDAVSLAKAIDACLTHSEISTLSKSLQARFQDKYSPELQKKRVSEIFTNAKNESYEN